MLPRHVRPYKLKALKLNIILFRWHHAAPLTQWVRTALAGSRSRASTSSTAGAPRPADLLELVMDTVFFFFFALADFNVEASVGCASEAERPVV